MIDCDPRTSVVTIKATSGEITTVSAPADGTVKSLLVSKGDQVDSGDLLVRLG